VARLLGYFKGVRVQATRWSIGLVVIIGQYVIINGCAFCCIYVVVIGNRGIIDGRNGNSEDACGGGASICDGVAEVGYSAIKI
jgi:hypothetical protein